MDFRPAHPGTTALPGASEIEGDSAFATDVEFAIVHNDSPMTGRPWRCNSGRTANIATRTCRRTRWRRASALTSAHSVRTAPRTNWATFAPTAAVVLSRGRSGRRKSGGLDYRLQSGRHRTSGCTCHILSTISLRIRHASGIFRRRIVERPCRHSGSIEPGITQKVQTARPTACSDRTAFPIPSSNRRSRPAASGSLPHAR
jgi:hypothetical protein